MPEYIVYLLQSKKDGMYYIGQTANLEQRVKAHNSGEVKSTRHRRPLVLLGCQSFPNREEARYFEFQVKRHSDKKARFIAQFARLSGPEARTP
ncbi:MAG: GIY-YIG nuclease family protein [Deltaproteobacteria bacterium]|uniref:GIY-YIG nuclease family protein n=1 Tax=Candidatus Desulfacyla euxinica TaxID=2841693 RepID=A0A8J6N108_9DELT|nr:GIY-YIG nuclease family protein [Candidatus Desulfacyla euxinica]MBC8177487.1 GIY-YIG nuclease family protein [Candidatus Desulfacyla euxinica]